MTDALAISRLFQQIAAKSGTIIEITQLQSGQSITLSDPCDKLSLNGPALVTVGSYTIGAPAGQELFNMDGQGPMVITAANNNTTVTKVRLAAPDSATDDATGPYDLKDYDESRFPNGKKFYYDGDHFRGEGELVVIKEDSLQDLLREWFDDDGDANDLLWDTPPKININHLVPRVIQMDDQIELSTGKAKRALRELVTYVRRRKAATLRLIEDCKRDSRVCFDDIEKVYGAGTRVTFDSDGAMQGGAVETIKLEKSMMGKWWQVVVRYIGTDGTDFKAERKTIIIPFFGGSRPFSSLPISLLVEGSANHQYLLERGNAFIKYGSGHHYLTYTDAAIDESGRWKVRVRATGRVMVDPASYKMMNPNISSQAEHYSRSGSDVVKEVSMKDRVICGAFLRGFSFSAKRWLMFAVDRLNPIVFDDQAFDALVLDKPIKDTLKALVVSGGSTTGLDVITGKSEGLILLLAGAPGVGKTLTCEAVAEHLHMPLYSVSVGELGDTITTLETRLRSLLEISARWNAVTLIDEADIFMHARDDKDVVRNGFVGIFLRLLEYHQGILFLTTNRYQSFDPAFRSRISLCLEYSTLDLSARQQIWSTYLGRTKTNSTVSVERFAPYNLNGREIRSLIRIAATLAKTEGDGTLTNDHVQKVLDIQPAFGDFCRVDQTDM